MQPPARAVLKGEKKGLRNVNRNESSQGRSLLHGHRTFSSLAVGGGGGWRLVTDGVWRLAVGGSWRLVVVGGWRQLAVGGGWRLAAVGVWWLVVPGDCP